MMLCAPRCITCQDPIACLHYAQICCRSRMRRILSSVTLDVIMPQAGYYIAVGLEYDVPSEEPLVHPGMSMPWT